MAAMIKILLREGHQWVRQVVHGIEMPDGSVWDEVNGWRKKDDTDGSTGGSDSSGPSGLSFGTRREGGEF